MSRFPWIPTFARAGSCWLKSTGITTADPYKSQDPVTRAQMAAFLYRLGSTLGQWLAVSS
jgi:hypothetical protein